MKLSEYIADLQKIANKYPDLKVIYSKDDEGNGYNTVNYTPSIGHFSNGEFFSHNKSSMTVAEIKEGIRNVNAVLIN